MSFAVWRALLYKSYSIYSKKNFLSVIFEIITPCLFLILFIEMGILMSQYSPKPKNTKEENTQNGLQTMDLRLDQLNNFTKYEVKSMNINQHDGKFTKPKFQDPNILMEERYNDMKKEKYDDGGEVNKIIEVPVEDESEMMREKWKMYCGIIILLSFLMLWSKAGVLSQAERMSGTVERMRIYGVSDWTIIFSYVVHTGIKLLISSLLFSILLKMRLGGPPLIENIDLFSLFVALFLLNIHCTVYFLVVGSFVNSTILRSIIESVSFVYLYFWAFKQHFSVTAQYFANILAPFCLATTSSLACGLEESGGVTLKSLISTTDYNDIPLLVISLLVIFGSAVALLIFFYFLNINPGPYGSARPFYFILPKCLHIYFRPEYYKGDKRKNEKFRKGLYEQTPPNIDVGIKIENLYKKYGNLTSVKNLSLNIYSGQITAILGHNGAGKTTTLSILSGMLSPTSGSAFYQGYDIFTNIRKFRKDIGLCPQNNLFHPNLKVINQLIFFGMLGGLSMKEAKHSANDLLKVVGIFEKKNVAVTKLSGGMQRKLCIALSLVGSPKVVILDEPSSGVDPESRREIWNILLHSRENRILLLTTHFMEEADVLGDQIAIMNHGEIVCYGSPMFLKKHYGAGYNILVSCSHEKHKEITKTITAEIPDATIIGENQEGIKFKLPFNETKHFPVLFKQLETNNTSIIAINCTTMEDVYLKVEAEEGGEIPAASGSPFLQVKCTCEEGKLRAYFYRFLELVKKNMICSLAIWFKTFIVIVISPPVITYIVMDWVNTDVNKLNKFINAEEGFSDSVSDYNPCLPDPTLFLRFRVFSTFLAYAIFIVSSTFTNFVHKERISTIKHLMLMTGVSPITYWCSVLLWDAILYLIFVLISWITFLILDFGSLFDTGSGIYVLFLILFLSGISMISLAYFVSLLFKTMRIMIPFYISAIPVFGVISQYVIPIPSIHPYSQILKLQPFTASSIAMVDFITLAGNKRYCNMCPSEECADILKSEYLKDEDLRIDLLFLAVDLFLFFSLVVLTDYGLFPFLWYKIYSIFIGNIDNTGLKEVNSDVAREKSRIDGLETTESQQEIIAIVDGLAKKYSRSMVAVVDVTFAVSKGECFGLLGVNGAGKSTTFNMLTGVLYPTKGNVFIKGHSLKKEKAKCLSMIGYCPQHNALIESLTSKQMLTLFARLRLVPSQHVDNEVEKWITLFGLEEYSDVPSKNYSGGNKRKLNAALAFIGDPSIILLDEPTSGVDPFIRRNLWSVIEACGNYDQAIIISSHSMNECEAVCKRLTIMAAGKMECIGNIQHLKTLYGTGYVIKLTLSSHTDDELATLKSIVESAFSPHCELKDEHQILLHYHIKTNIYKISSLFEIMEQIKAQSNIVSDYIITDSSLEEVFLYLAKKQNN